MPMGHSLGVTSGRPRSSAMDAVVGFRSSGHSHSDIPTDALVTKDNVYGSLLMIIHGLLKSRMEFLNRGRPIHPPSLLTDRSEKGITRAVHSVPRCIVSRR